MTGRQVIKTMGGGNEKKRQPKRPSSAAKIPAASNMIARVGQTVRIICSPCGLFLASHRPVPASGLGIHDSYITGLKNKLLTTVS
jgi:hypothetical protein